MDKVLFLIALAFTLYYPFYEAKKDYKLMLKDGSKDSLKEKFHARNLLRRGTILTAVSAFANVGFELPLYGYWVLGAAFLLFAGCWFGFWFNSRLSFLRGLYPWYVSHDPRAAKTDRTIIRYARKYRITPEVLNKRIYTYSLILSIAIFILTYILILT